jgi:mRNA interferase RelE/StbE
MADIWPSKDFAIGGITKGKTIREHEPIDTSGQAIEPRSECCPQPNKGGFIVSLCRVKPEKARKLKPPPNMLFRIQINKVLHVPFYVIITCKSSCSGVDDRPFQQPLLAQSLDRSVSFF